MLRRILVVVFIGLWIGAVVYPDPRPFVTSVKRLKAPPIDATAVRGIASTLPDDYKVIEDFSTGYVAFRPAWVVYGLPWYFPTVAEVVKDRAGDCQARAILAASILQAKGMPYTLRYSFDHVWVDYPGKVVTDLENPDASFVADDGGGWLAKLPKSIPIGSIVKERVAFHWTPMPLFQKIMIVFGTVLIIGWGEKNLLRRLGSRMRWPMRKKAIA